MASWLAVIALVLCSSLLQAKEAAPAADDPVLEARMVTLASRLRCLVCQNQSIADSNASLAVDLRNQVRDMLRQGDTDEQILQYMTARYGDFVLYQPPLKSKTALLWFGPGALLVVGLGSLFLVLRRRSRMDPSLFDSEPDEAVDNEPPLPTATSRQKTTMASL
jgi:cytochrome c-type biogenesis protein CcmH